MIELHETNNFISEYKQSCQTFNKYFTNVTKRLKIRQTDKFRSFENEENYRLIEEYIMVTKIFLVTQYGQKNLT